jgi:hypothetical protein
LISFEIINILFHSVINKIDGGQYPVLAIHFPAFLYEDGYFDPENLLHGLLRGHLLVRVSQSLITDRTLANPFTVFQEYIFGPSKRAE